MVRVNSDALKYNFIQVLLDELKGQKRECSKHYKCSNNTSWRNFLNGFKILKSTTRQPANQIRLKFQW
ncbi:hypothetical protein A4A49_24480 [Nicotiana attenuata]|uniref:Uncharacterized protein n=1 Tax=Nicotiana attenuata TaxID=49451 RepID=A0A314L0T4_NICAT|nr:hypothetical protein A4A49_24480 [Nicotiana attenuata]